MTGMSRLRFVAVGLALAGGWFVFAGPEDWTNEAGNLVGGVLLFFAFGFNLEHVHRRAGYGRYWSDYDTRELRRDMERRQAKKRFSQ